MIADLQKGVLGKSVYERNELVHLGEKGSRLGSHPAHEKPPTEISSYQLEMDEKSILQPFVSDGAQGDVDFLAGEKIGQATERPGENGGPGGSPERRKKIHFIKTGLIRSSSIDICRRKKVVRRR